MSHMAYPESGSFETGGPCPASHPVRMSQLFYEVIWDTKKFNDKSIWPIDGSQPFVVSRSLFNTSKKQALIETLVELR